MTRPEDFYMYASGGEVAYIICPLCNVLMDLDIGQEDTLGEMLELAIRHLAEKHPKIIDASIDRIEE